MTASDTKRALKLIDGHLGRLPAHDREKIAEEILGDLTSFFVLSPFPTAREEAATRATLDALLPGMFGRGGSS